MRKKKKQKKRSKNIKGQSLIIAALNEKDLTEKALQNGRNEIHGGTCNEHCGMR